VATVVFADSANQVEFQIADSSTAGDVLKVSGFFGAIHTSDLPRLQRATPASFSLLSVVVTLVSDYVTL
jgi:hypothetical protein